MPRVCLPLLFAAVCFIPARALFFGDAAAVVLRAQPPAPPEPALAKKIDAIVTGADYKHATWGIYVVDAATGETVYSRNPDAMLAPASVTKLFSGAAALVALGADHTQDTVVYKRERLPTVKGTLHGDLILVASGDLTMGGRAKNGKTVFVNNDHTYANGGAGTAELTDTDPLAGLDALAKQVKDAGITQVEGDVLIDDRLFARSSSSGSGPDAVTPIMVNDNVVDLLITPGEKPGDAARVKVRPETAFYNVDAVVATGDAKAAADLRLLVVGPNQFAVRGTVPVGGKPQVRVLTVDDPVGFARALFVESLRRNGVRAQCAVIRSVGGALPAKNDYNTLPKVATLTSAPFKETLAVTLKVSHNLYASAFPCLVAASKGQTTADAGLREQRRILEKLGVDVGAVSFAGGAGGAQADHVTARATVQLIQGMSKRVEWDAYKAALPILGVDGTLAETVAADCPARGKVFAKTGTLFWRDAVNERSLLRSKALAGTMTTKSGRALHFCMIVNNVPLPPGESPTREGKVLGRLCEILYAE